VRSIKGLFLVLVAALFLAWHASFVYSQNETSALAPEARDYLHRVLDIIQNSSVKRETNWDEFRRLTIEKAAKAQVPADTYPAIRDALKRLGDSHSGLFTPDDLKALESGRAAGTRRDVGMRVKDLVVIMVYPKGSASRAAIEVRDKVLAIDGNPLTTDSDYSRIINEAKKNNAKGIELTLKRGNAEPRKIQLEFSEFDLNLPAQNRLVSEDIGLIELPAFGVSLTDPKKAMEESTQYAERVQALIRELDQKKLSGWIVDLRLNGGGNMWPMLAGIGPILGEGEVGGFVAARGASKWSYQDGQAMVNQNPVAKVGTVYRVKNENLPVVILTDEFTASSGEAVVIAFKGRAKTTFIGMPSRGVPTANSPFKLSDGAILNLTVALDADRTGKTYDSKIPPETEVKTMWAFYRTDDDPVIKAAVRWLKNQK
jgi:C-terminal processing protease CtpA/Prc